MQKILVTFALFQEGATFEGRLAGRLRVGAVSSGRLHGAEVAVTWVGIKATEQQQLINIFSDFRPEAVVNSGFAGAVRSLLEPGDFLMARNFTSPNFAHRLSKLRLFEACGAFSTVNALANPDQKAQTAERGKILAVDMESAVLAGICQEREIPLVTARMVSDRFDESIPKIFAGKGISGPGDLADAAQFAGRMIRLRGRLADRLAELIKILSEGSIFL